MKVMVKSNGRSVEIELTDEQAKAVKAVTTRTGWERVGEFREYLFIGSGGYQWFTECGDEHDGANYDDANYFSNESLCADVFRAQTLWRKIMRWIAEHCEDVHWDENEDYCAIFWDYKYDVVSFWKCPYRRSFMTPYFDTIKHAEECAEEFKDELTWYFKEFKGRAKQDV